MLNSSEIKTLCEESHRIAEEHGWLDTPRPFGTIMALLHSELSEALEEFRAHRGLAEIYYETTKGECSEAEAPERLAQGYKLKPCGIPIELADFLIRIAQEIETADFTGRFCSLFNGPSGVSVGKGLYLGQHEFDAGFDADLLPNLHRLVSKAYDEGSFNVIAAAYLHTAFVLTVLYCDRFEIDIRRALEIKAAYNEKRPYRHGGKAC